jgi:hypothetical protein
MTHHCADQSKESNKFRKTGSWCKDYEIISRYQQMDSLVEAHCFKKNVII